MASAASANAQILTHKESLSEQQKLAVSAIQFDKRYRSGSVSLREIPKDIRLFIKGLPPQPYLTGWAMFVASRLHGKPNITTEMAQVASQWKTLSSNEQAEYQSRVDADLRAYRQAISEYLAGTFPRSTERSSTAQSS